MSNPRFRRLLGTGIAALSVAAGAPAFTVTYRGHQERDAAATGYTFNDGGGFDIGAASADRIVWAFLWNRDGSNFTLTGVTIQGIPATAAVNLNAGEARGLSAWYAAVPSGTTAVVEVTPSAEIDRCACAVVTITGTTQTTPADVSGAIPNSSAGNVDSWAASELTVPAGGVAIAAAWIGNSTHSTTTWSQTSGTGTKPLDELVGTAMIGSIWISTEAGNQVFTADGQNTSQYRVLAVAWGP